MLVVLPDVPRVDPFLRVDGGKPLAVRVPSELAGKYTVRTEPGERDRAVGPLAAGDIAVAVVHLRDRFPGVRHTAHSLHKINVRAADDEDSLLYHSSYPFASSYNTIRFRYACAVFDRSHMPWNALHPAVLAWEGSVLGHIPRKSSRTAAFPYFRSARTASSAAMMPSLPLS